MKTIFFFLVTICCFGQNKKLTDEQYNQSGAGKILYAKNTQEAEKLAESDLKLNIPFLIVHGGIAPIVYPTDKEFEKLYGVHYYILGCETPGYEILDAYNNVILNYLCVTHGKVWKKTIRKDVTGLKVFKKKNGC